MLERLITSAIDWINKRPALVRAMSSAAYSKGSVLKIGSLYVVLGYYEVTQVLSRGLDFTLAPILRSRILSGDFLLTQDESIQYLEDKRKMRRAFYGHNFDLISEINIFAAERSKEILHSSNPETELDCVGELAERVASDILFELVLGYTRHAPEDFIVAVRWLAKLIVAGKYTENKSEYDHSVTVLLRYIDERLDTADGDWRSQSVVGEMLQQECTRAEIKRFIGGIAAAGVATIARACGQAINELLHRPEAMAISCEAARQGDAPTVLQCSMEALRFNPMFLFIARECASATHIDCKDGQRIDIPKGATVTLGLYSAMLDKRGLPDPERFMNNRPLGDYLHFGDSLHRCFGEAMAHAQISQIMMALLRHGKVLSRSTRAGHGYLEYEGPALRHLWVKTS